MFKAMFPPRKGQFPTTKGALKGGGFPTSKGAGGGVFPTSKSSGGGVNGALAPHAPNGTTHQHHQAHSVYAAKKHLKPCDLPSFELGRVLGTGSFGRVSFARHRSTGTLVAIKVLSKAEVEHIKAERSILDKVDHPFIVKLLGSSQDERCLHFILEYVVGGEFFTHLRQAGRFSDETSRFYAAEIILALEYLHGNGIVYRDLKPENILIDREGHLKITDFGFAKEINDSRTYTLCGTPDYLAPEIIKNKGHGMAVDWWALGVLIFEMLSGYPPFYDNDPLGTYQKILEADVEFPTHFNRWGDTVTP